MKIVVSGATGLIGSSLVSFLQEKGHEVHKLVRSRANLGENEIAWDPDHGVIDSSFLKGMDAMIHLAGENILGRWTEAKKEKIWKSRVEGTRQLCEVLSALQHPPSIFISASAIGYYGNRGEETLTEESAKGEGFLSDVCAEWERSSLILQEKGIRTFALRFGMVLSSRGGALKQMLPLFKLGLGGVLGSGKQWMSWIALEDVLRVIEFALHQKSLAGPVNVVSPFPVTNFAFTKTLGCILHRPTFMGVPTFAVKVMFGELGKEVFLSSERVLPAKLQEAGFSFAYPELEGALKHMIK